MYLPLWETDITSPKNYLPNLKNYFQNISHKNTKLDTYINVKNRYTTSNESWTSPKTINLKSIFRKIRLIYEYRS